MNDEDLQTLQSQPSVLQLDAILFKPTVDRLQEFRLVNILINDIIGLFDDLKESQRRQIILIFTSLSGVSSLVNHLKLSTVLTKNSALQCVVILDKVLQDQVLYQLISKESNDLKLNELRNLFFGSKIFESYSKLFVELQITREYSKPDVYMAKLEKELISLLQSGFTNYSYLSTLLVSFFRLDDNSISILKNLLSDQFVDQFYTIFSNTRALKSLIISAIIKYLNRTTMGITDLTKLSQTISRFPLDFKSLENATNYGNVALLQVLVSSITSSQRFEFCMRGLQTWGDMGFIGKTPLSLQESYTNLLVLLIQSLENSQLLQLSQDPVFLSSITNRISSTSDRIRSLGMMIGNLIFITMGKEAIFKIDEEIAFANQYMERFKSPLQADQALAIIEDDVEAKFSNMVLVDSDHELDDDPEDSDDDPTIADRSKPNKPLFLKELVSYLNADSSKDKQSYDKRALALKYGPKLIFRSSLKNLRFYNESLISLLIGLNNENEDSHFDDLRLKCLISCCVQDPEEGATILLKRFIGGDYSLQQRLTLLSALSLSARYLRGYNDASFNVDESLVQFKSKLLPEASHRQFMDPNSSLLLSIETTLESEIVNETIDQNREKLMGEGNILRISSRLQTPKKRSSVLLKTRNLNFYKIIGSNFFFPLTSVWFALHQETNFNLGKFSSILSSHFLKSIGLILQTTFPSAKDLQDIVKSALEIVISVSRSLFRLRQGDEGNQDILVLNAAIFIVLVVLDNSSAQFLIDFCLNELVVIRNFTVDLLNEEMESLSVDEFLVQKIFTVSFRLNEIFEKFERLLVGVDGL